MFCVSNKIRKSNAYVDSVCFWKKQNFQILLFRLIQLFYILLRSTLGALFQLYGRKRGGRHGIGYLTVLNRRIIGKSPLRILQGFFFFFFGLV